MSQTNGYSIEDVNCAQCGYLLRGRPSGDKCSECGLPAARSFRPDLLQYSSPRWLRDLASGCRMTGVAVVAMLLVDIVLTLPLPPVDSALDVIIITTGFLLIILTRLGVVIGVRRLAAVEHPGPPTAMKRWGWRMRRPALWLVVGVFSLDVLRVMGAPISELDGVRSFLMNIPFPFLGIEWDLISDLLLAGGVVAGLVYLRGLAARLPDEKLRRSLGVVLWVLPVLLVLEALFIAMALLQLTVWLGPESSVEDIERVVAMQMAVQAGLGAAVVFCSIFFAVLLQRMRGRLLIAAERAAADTQRKLRVVTRAE